MLIALKMKSKQLLFLGLYLLISINIKAQSVFQKTYGASGNDRNYSIAKTNDGGYVTTGYTESFNNGNTDIVVSRLNAFGQILWTKTYGGAGNDVAWKIIKSSYGGFILGGHTSSAGGFNKGFVMKIDESGDREWLTLLSDTGDVEIYGLTETKKGSIVATGYINKALSPNGDDLFIAKLYSDGSYAFSKWFGTAGIEEGFNVIEDSDGKYVFAGYARNSTSLQNKNHFYIVKTDTSGNVIRDLAMSAFSFTNNLFDMRGNDLTQIDDQYFLTGWSSEVGLVLMAVDMHLNASFPVKRLVRAIGGPSYGLSFTITKTSDNLVAIAGYISNGPGGGRDALLVKLTQSGTVVFAKAYGGTLTDGHWPTGLLQEKDGGYAILSSSNTFGINNSYDFFLTRTDAQGVAPCNYHTVTPASVGYSNFNFIHYSAANKFSGTHQSYIFNDTTRHFTEQTLCCKLKASVNNIPIVCLGSPFGLLNKVGMGKDSVAGYYYQWNYNLNGNKSFYSTRANPFYFPYSTNAKDTFKVKVTSIDATCDADSNYFVPDVKSRPERKQAQLQFGCDGDSILLEPPSVLNPLNNDLASWFGRYVNENSFALWVKKSDTIVLNMSINYQNGFCVYFDTFRTSFYKFQHPLLKDSFKYCENSSVEVVMWYAPDYRYKWETPFTGSDTTYKAIFREGTHKVTVTYSPLSCKFSDTLWVFENPNPGDMLPDKIELCENDSMFLVINRNTPLISRVWSEAPYYNGIKHQNTDSFLIKTSETAGDRFVLIAAVTDKGCYGRDSTEVNVLPLPKFSFGKDTVICMDSSLLLSGPPNMAEYIWNTTQNSPSISVFDSGYYFLQVKDSAGCSFQDDIVVGLRNCFNSFKQLTNSAFKIYPIPVSEILIVEWQHSNLLNTTFQLLSSDGKLMDVPTLSQEANKAVLSVKNIPNGVYVVFNNGSYIGRMSIVR